MSSYIPVFYGSYRSDRIGIRLATYIMDGLGKRGENPELIDAKAVGLPILDRMYKEYPKGEAPPAMEELAQKIRAADAFVFVTGEYNWGMQPGLKNLTDHYLEEWFWRPAAVASYSSGRLAGTRSNSAWHLIPAAQSLDSPRGFPSAPLCELMLSASICGGGNGWGCDYSNGYERRRFARGGQAIGERQAGVAHPGHCDGARWFQPRGGGAALRHGPADACATGFTATIRQVWMGSLTGLEAAGLRA